MMKKILTGLQVTGDLHLGNLIGALEPAIEAAYADPTGGKVCIFLADLHSLTSRPSCSALHNYTKQAAATYIALGAAQDRCLIYRQSRIPEVCELMWYISCLASYNRLKKAHAFKTKSETPGYQPSVGLFAYPVLMAADILIASATHVPVGKDQHQHMELANHLARMCNRVYGTNWPLPQAFSYQVPTVPGTDGRKMSKSYRNTIAPLLPEDRLVQQIKKIKTGSEPLEAPKDPASCLVFQIYAAVAPQQKIDQMRQGYLQGGYGYQRAKKALSDELIDRYATARAAYQQLISDPQAIENRLQADEKIVRQQAQEKIKSIREKIGFTPFIS